MARLMNWYGFERKTKGKGISLFTIVEIQRLFGITKVATNFLLQRYTKRGFIIRLKRGLYAFPDALPSDLYIANKLYSPSYISLEFAMAYHGVIPEIVYEITSVTTKATRRFEVKTLGKVFSYRKIKKAAYIGYNLQKSQDKSFNIADAEKAFVDANYLRLLSKQKPISRFRKEKINRAKAIRYAEFFGNKKLISVIKTTLK